MSVAVWAHCSNGLKGAIWQFTPNNNWIRSHSTIYIKKFLDMIKFNYNKKLFFKKKKIK